MRRWQVFGRRWGKRASQPEKELGTFVQDVEWQRNEELRPDRLGPTEDDVHPIPADRPKRTLGPIPKH